MDSKKSYFPWPAPVLAFIILIIMLFAASFSPQAQAEKSVKHFYNAYFTENHDDMVKYVSTLWVYNHLQINESYQSALTQRTQYEEKIQLLLTFANDLALANNQTHIKVNPQYTVVGDFSALVVFEASSPISSNLYMAVLIFEDQQYRMLQAIPLDEELLQILNQDVLTQFETTLQELFKITTMS